MADKPTIRGIFVNSHVKALRNSKGDTAVLELEKRFGKSVSFSNSQEVLVSDEVKIIEHCLDILSDTPISPEQKSFEGGKLHFQNFVTTPLAKIIFSLFKNNFKLMMMNSSKIAGHVFQGVKFSSKEISEKEVVVTMENNDYSIDHFKGLFQEWMKFSGLEGTVESRETGNHAYEYSMKWN